MGMDLWMSFEANLFKILSGLGLVIRKFIIKLQKSQIHFELLNLEIYYLYVPFFNYNEIVCV